jgi:hypothetical protein
VIMLELQGSINMFHMGVPHFSIDQDIIKEDRNKISLQGLKNLVHEALKGGWSIANSKGHH